MRPFDCKTPSILQPNLKRQVSKLGTGPSKIYDNDTFGKALFNLLYSDKQEVLKKYLFSTLFTFWDFPVGLLQKPNLWRLEGLPRLILIDSEAWTASVFQLRV